MKFNPALVDKTHTVGVGTIEDFQGCHTAVASDLLKKAMDLLEDFKGHGFSASTLTFGIEERTSDNKPGNLVIFLDEKQKIGLVVASLLEDAE